MATPSGAVVTFSLTNLPDNYMSCSGIVLDADQGFVLTSGILMGAFMNSFHADKLQNLLETASNNNDLVPFLNDSGEISVILPSNKVVSSQTSDKCELSTDEWRFFAAWKCEKLNDAFNFMFPETNGWNLDMNNCDKDDRNISQQEKYLARNLLSYFLLIQTKSMNSSHVVVRLLELFKNCPSVVAGDVVRVVSTPFANLSPSVFLNSISQGIIANVAGKDEVLIMTDARSVPGCEGGALYAKGASGQFRNLVGIVVLPFCWRQSEWVGLSFVCSIKQVIESLVSSAKLNYAVNRSKSSEALQWDAARKSIVLIKSGLQWGSGFLLNCSSQSRVLDRNEGLILTCSHVIQGRRQGKVKVHLYGQQIVDADILYAAPKDAVFDVAVLRVDLPTNANVTSLSLQNDVPAEGDEVVCIGHALFDDAHHQLPMMTQGLISKVISYQNRVVMLQASCAIHPGASGGALLSTANGNLYGVVVCNTKDENSGASYPHISICIPSTVIFKSLEQYLSTGNVGIFECIHNTDDAIQDLWTLRQYNLGGDLSKL